MRGIENVKKFFFPHPYAYPYGGLLMGVEGSVGFAKWIFAIYK
jgi:hypothetical protein